MESCREQESERLESKEGDFVEENRQKFLVAGGTILAMACFRRILLVLLIGQCRVKVFLVLNLVLLAIFVTSTRGSSTEKQEGIGSLEMKNGKKKKRGLMTKNCDKKVERISDGNEDTEVSCETPKLSKEELNERVEAFIAMFRQQLILDARKGGTPVGVSRSTRNEMSCFGNGSKLGISTTEAGHFVF